MTSIWDEAKTAFLELEAHNRAFAQKYPGPSPARQPVHTVYGGAHLFRADTTARLGVLALESLATYGRDAAEFALGTGVVREAAALADGAASLDARYRADVGELRRVSPEAWLACAVFERVKQKLQREPVEDFRIDFEDGFGARSDAEEDDAAHGAAREMAKALTDRTLSPFSGIRVKCFNAEWAARGVRTLELFMGTLLAETHGALPDNFVVTLPKVTIAAQPRALVRAFEVLERRHGLAPGSLKMEIMVEQTQALIGPDGRCPLSDIVAAAEGRCTGADLGTYDFTASCDLTASQQVMRHPWCDLAKGLMVLALSGTGVFLSDGATNVMPVPVHKKSPLSEAESAANRASVHAAWRLSYSNIRHSLAGGFYQGWDLHPAQLPVRYAATYAFFLEGFAAAAERLANFIDKAAKATLVGDVFDDAATGQGLLNYFLRARGCGAISDADVAQTGLTLDEFRLRSFAKILESRRRRS